MCVCALNVFSSLGLFVNDGNRWSSLDASCETIFWRAEGAFSDHSCRRHSRTALIYIFLKPDILINISVYIFSLRKQQEEKQESSNDEYVYTFSRHGAHTHIHVFFTLRFIISFDSQHSLEILVIRFFDTHNFMYLPTKNKREKKCA